MAGQTYSPYRRAGRQVARPAGFGRDASPRRSALSQALLAPEADGPAPVRRSLSSGGFLSGTASLRGLTDPAARRWVVLGALGIVSSLLLTVAVALLSDRGVASASMPAVETARASRVTLVREIGGVPKSPTPGTGVTASAPAAPGSATALDTSVPQAIASNAIRQLRKVGRAIVTADGIRRLALGGALPFSDGGTVTAAVPSDDPQQVALADADPEVTLGAGSVFLRMADGVDDFFKSVNQPGQRDVVALASPAVVTTATTTTRAEQAATATAVPPTATPIPAKYTSSEVSHRLGG